MKIKIKKLDSRAKVPGYAHPGDAGMDIFALNAATLKPGERAQVRTGLAFEIPDDFVGLVWDKSGLSHKHGLKTLGGVLDSGYRGELFVGVVNLGKEPYTIEAGHKIAQLLIQPVDRAEIVEAEELSETSRGDGGIGSTGK